MKNFLFIALSVFLNSLNAQKTVNVSPGDINPLSPAFFRVVTGEPFVSVRFSKLVTGSPYFKDDWMKGNVVLNDGKQYNDTYIKIDLYDNGVHFMNQQGVEMIATTPIQKITLFDSAVQQSFNFVNRSYIDTKSRLSGWYQSLVSGKASLFKKFEKRLQEFTPSGSATVEQSIYTVFHYYILYNGNLKEMKKPKDLPGIIDYRKEELAQYIRNKNLAGKANDDFESAVNYFNGLN